MRAALAPLPSAPGVYRFRDAEGRILYVGRASDLRRRVASYWGPLGDRRHLAPMVARIDRVEAVACDSEHEAAWLERNLLERAKPRWNRIVGGAEVPVFIRLGRRGLAVVHDARPWPDARHFGPYLGGSKVRLAVTALRRVLPLFYASDGLSGSGRAMARVRGVDPCDRPALVRAVTAVLERDPPALARVRAELAQRRDRAAEALVFEFAAQVQAEMEALDWVVSEQKAALLEPADLDVHGWADGILVSFEIRDGRLCAWRQRPCREAAAAARVAATPAAWTPFARRNAELAARMLGARPRSERSASGLV